MTTPEKPLSVGRQVKAILQQNKITMKDLAPKVGYSREHLKMQWHIICYYCGRHFLPAKCTI